MKMVEEYKNAFLKFYFLNTDFSLIILNPNIKIKNHLKHSSVMNSVLNI